METQTSQTILTPIIKGLLEDKGDILDYQSPKFNWDSVDEGSQTIDENNPFSGL
jgi:hypothetical protein